MDVNLRQLERAKRYLVRLRRIYEGSYLPGSADEYEDEVISFFIHCYHIRDWIINLSKTPVTSKEIDEFINNHDALRICADLCNGEKHCRLVRNKRTGGQPHIAYRDYRVTHYTPDSGALSTYKASYKIKSGPCLHDALEIAEQCITLWEEFVSSIQPEYLKG